MDLHVIFIGVKFIYNVALKEYVLRQIEKSCGSVRSINFYKDSENALFLELQNKLETTENILIVTSKNSYATVGKLLCTITEDNLSIKEENLLLPSTVEVFEKNSYLLVYNTHHINVLCADGMKKLPTIFLKNEKDEQIVQLFGETEQSAKALLEPLSQTYDIKLEFVQIINGWIELHVKGKKYGNVTKFVNSLKQLIPKKVIITENIMEYIIEVLEQKQKTISFAESCTGGLLSYFLTKNNGASQIFNGSLITYSNEIKSKWLAVDEEILQSFGAVSREVVEQMADGVMRVSDADYTISISGIAGDGGGTQEKPVGTVYIGIKTASYQFQEHFIFQGDRNYIQHQSVLYSIKMLLLSDIETFFDI